MRSEVDSAAGAGDPTEQDFVPVAETSEISGLPPHSLDDWRLDEELRDVRRMLRVLKVYPPAGGEPNERAALLDASAAGLPAWHGELARPRRSASSAGGSAQENLPKRRPAILAWGLLSLGLAVFVCGAVLLGWSFATGRGDLWRLGMPLALGGQAGLLIGLVLQLESLWQNTRDTSSTLGELDTQLRDLKHATTMLSTTHSTPAQSFYAHVAEGASPELLLADLKGQLDLLATQLAHSRR